MLLVFSSHCVAVTEDPSKTMTKSNSSGGSVANMAHEMWCLDQFPIYIRQLVYNAPEKVAVTSMVEEGWEEWEMLQVLEELYEEHGLNVPSFEDA